jgi:hypothetical protein
MALLAQNGLMSAILSGVTQAVAGTPAENALAGVKVGLFTGTPTLSGNNLLADLNAPTSTGMIALSSAITWGASYIDSLGNQTISSNLIPFVASAVVGGDIITGFYLVAGSGSPTVPLAAELFAHPINIVSVGDGFNLVVNLKISSDMVGSSNVID